MLPPALEIRHKVEQILAGLSEVPGEQTVREMLEELNREIGRINAGAHTGPPTRQPLLDVEARLEEWRAERRRRGEPA